MIDFVSTLVDGMSRPLTYFISPGRRLFIPALLTSLAMAIGAFFYYQRKGRVVGALSVGNMVKYLFPKRIWTHRSSVVDYELIFLNAVINVFLTAPFLVYLAFLTEAVWALWILALGEATPADWSHAGILVSFTIALFLVDDFRWVFRHWLFHKVPVLWLFHKVHHTAEVLTPFTYRRNHPCETFIVHCHVLVAYSLVTGSFLYFVGNNLSLLDVFYVGMARKIFPLVGANLRHSHIWISWGNFMEHIFISPAQHQIHHSDALEHRDKNLGLVLAIWDWLFGTLVIAGEQKELSFGIGEHQNKRCRSLWGAVSSPFVDSWAMILALPQTLKHLAWTKR